MIILDIFQVIPTEKNPNIGFNIVLSDPIREKQAVVFMPKVDETERAMVRRIALLLRRLQYEGNGR